MHGCRRIAVDPEIAADAETYIRATFNTNTWPMSDDETVRDGAVRLCTDDRFAALSRLRRIRPGQHVAIILLGRDEHFR